MVLLALTGTSFDCMAVLHTTKFCVYLFLSNDYWVLKSLICTKAIHQVFFSSTIKLYTKRQKTKSRKRGRKKRVILTSVTIVLRRNLTKSMSQDLQVQGHENNAQKLQLEVCKGKNVTATPGCIGEGGRVGSQVKWKPLSMRKVKAIFNMRITLSLPSALMYSQVGSHLQRAILCSACPLVLQASHLSPWWFTTHTWSDMWWKSTLGRSQCYLEQPQVGTVGSLNLGSLQGWCNHRELSLEDELEMGCHNLSTVIVTLMKTFVFLDQVQKRGYFTTSSVSGYSSWYIWQMANNITVHMTKNSSRTPAGAALCPLLLPAMWVIP